MFHERIKKFCQHLHLLKSDIMIIVKETWPLAFRDIPSNIQAILERGWNPLTKVLLLHLQF